MEAPSDSRNLYDWHQDQSYYPQNEGNGEKGLVVWVPLLRLTSIQAGALTTANVATMRVLKPIKTQESGAQFANTVSNDRMKKYEKFLFHWL